MSTNQKNNVLNVLIVGAGVAGKELARAIRKQPGKVHLIGFLDDSFTGKRFRVAGLPILGNITNLTDITKQRNVEQVYIAIPSAKGELIRRVISACADARVSFRIVPRVLELIEGRVELGQVREIQPEDLLGRAIIKSDQRMLHKFFTSKVILVTGAAGSIGSELCRQIAEYHPKLLVAVDWRESGLYDFENDLRDRHPGLNLDTQIVNIQDAKKVDALFRRIRPEIVFHAAAFKHVPLMERFPEEALQNNILGTWNVAKAAKRVRAKKFILISTDKAVHPTSVMGATKAVAEVLIQSLNSVTTHFSCVRFGNVLSSQGSVIPLFQKQINKGGPITITHPDMVRYFMSIPEAVQLILQSGRVTKGGDIFVLDMGEQIKIVDLAKTLIRLSGYRPEFDIHIIYTGIRPGEKLYEEILSEQEGIRATRQANIFVTTKHPNTSLAVNSILRQTRHLVHQGSGANIRKFLKKVIPDYHPTGIK